MKLLLDHNLPPRLAGRLAGMFPGTMHVRQLVLEREPDGVVWEYARNNGFAIVTKDEDYGEMAVLRGFPPKVVWLQLGNCTTDEVAAALRKRHAEVESFGSDPNGGIFVVGR